MKKISLITVLILNFFMTVQLVESVRIDAILQDFADKELLSYISDNSTTFYSKIFLGPYLTLILSLASLIILIVLIIKEFSSEKQSH